MKRSKNFDLIVFDWDGTLWCGHQRRLFDGVASLLARLQARGHRLAVATAMRRDDLDRALVHLGLDGVFDGSRTTDQTQDKPHPCMLLELMNELAAPPARTLMVGDTPRDLQMAQNAGCASLGVSYSGTLPDLMLRYQPRYVASSVAELDQWLAGNA